MASGINLPNKVELENQVRTQGTYNQVAGLTAGEKVLAQIAAPKQGTVVDNSNNRNNQARSSWGGVNR